MKRLWKKCYAGMCRLGEAFTSFAQEEDGMGTVELILILVVLIGLVIIFKKQMVDLVNSIFEKITKDSNSIMS